MKTINFELSKRLNDLWLLDNIETEFKYYKMWDTYISLHESEFYKSDWDNIKTLTLEKAIEFLPWKINMPKYHRWYLWDDVLCILAIEPKDDHIEVKYNHWNMWTYIWQSWKTPLEAIEKMIEYLLDNNLIWQEKN